MIEHDREKQPQPKPEETKNFWSELGKVLLGLPPYDTSYYDPEPERREYLPESSDPKES